MFAGLMAWAMAKQPSGPSPTFSVSRLHLCSARLARFCQTCDDAALRLQTSACRCLCKLLLLLPVPQHRQQAPSAAACRGNTCLIMLAEATHVK